MTPLRPVVAPAACVEPGWPSIAVLAVSAALGTGAWVGLVVQRGDDQRSISTGASFWWVMTFAAVGLGLVVGWERVSEVGLGLGLPQLALSPWTLPHGDDDGLWIIGIPLMFLAVFVYLVAASLGGALHTCLARAGRSA